MYYSIPQTKTLLIGCGSWCVYRNGSSSQTMGHTAKFFVNTTRASHKDPLTGASVETSLCDDVLQVFKKFASVSICESIIFGYHSNGNESRHSLIHRSTGNKRVPFWRGLLSRAQLHSVLRYDMSEEAMLTMILTEAGLRTFAPAVKKVVYLTVVWIYLTLPLSSQHSVVHGVMRNHSLSNHSPSTHSPSNHSP